MPETRGPGHPMSNERLDFSSGDFQNDPTLQFKNEIQARRLPKKPEQAPWPEAFVNPDVAAAKFKAILRSVGMEIE